MLIASRHWHSAAKSMPAVGYTAVSPRSQHRLHPQRTPCLCPSMRERRRRRAPVGLSPAAAARVAHPVFVPSKGRAGGAAGIGCCMHAFVQRQAPQAERRPLRLSSTLIQGAGGRAPAASAAATERRLHHEGAMLLASQTNKQNMAARTLFKQHAAPGRPPTGPCGGGGG